MSFYIPYPPSVGLLWGLLHNMFVFLFVYIEGLRNAIH